MGLPESIDPYIGLMIGGFLVAMYGHAAHSRWIVAIGIIMVFLATLLFPLAANVFEETPSPPGPRVPQALIAAPFA